MTARDRELTSVNWTVRIISALGVGLVASLAPLPLLAAPPPEMRGGWELVRPRFLTSIDLWVTDLGISAGLGCEVREYEVVTSGETFSAAPAGVVISRGCHRRDRTSLAAWAYWKGLDRQIVASTRFRIVGDKLVLVSSQGSLRFVRKQD